ncbi:MAG: hypothetical protein WDM96_08090 [Lacunisphaera sp.]
MPCPIIRPVRASPRPAPPSFSLLIAAGCASVTTTRPRSPHGSSGKARHFPTLAGQETFFNGTLTADVLVGAMTGFDASNDRGGGGSSGSGGHHHGGGMHMGGGRWGAVTGTAMAAPEVRGAAKAATPRAAAARRCAGPMRWARLRS